MILMISNSSSNGIPIFTSMLTKQKTTTKKKKPKKTVWF